MTHLDRAHFGWLGWQHGHGGGGGGRPHSFLFFAYATFLSRTGKRSGGGFFAPTFIPLSPRPTHAQCSHANREPPPPPLPNQSMSFDPDAAATRFRLGEVRPWNSSWNPENSVLSFSSGSPRLFSEHQGACYLAARQDKEEECAQCAVNTACLKLLGRRLSVVPFPSRRRTVNCHGECRMRIGLGAVARFFSPYRTTQDVFRRTSFDTILIIWLTHIRTTYHLFLLQGAR